MKKLILFLILCLVNVGVFAQVRATKIEAMQAQISEDVKWDSNIPKECFCCNEKIYNLPQIPPISGPQTVSCGTKAVFTTIPCNGATVSWTVSPSISGTTGDNTSTFTIPDNAPAGNYTITVEFRCGNKVLKNSMKFIITEVKNCTSDFNFIVTKNSDGSVNISTVPNMLVAGQEHWWGIQYNGAFPNCTACASIPFNQFNATASGVWGGYINATGALTPYMGTGITTGSSPYGISYTGFAVNKCVRITQYVKCCGVLKRSTYCFEITGAVSRMIKPTADSGNQIVDEEVTNLKN